MDETSWIEAAQKGDEAAWETLVRAYQEPVFRLGYLMLGDPDEAADAAQETFIRAYRALSRFDRARPLRPWLLQIVANLARNRRRSLGRYWAALQRRFEKDPPRDRDVESRAGVRMQAQRLWQAVCCLREEDQQMIYLRYFLDLPVQEAAAAAGVAEGTVKSRTSRALTRLRTVIEREFPDLRLEDKDGNELIG